MNRSIFQRMPTINIMNILYYYWNENSKDDCVESMERLGHKVTVWSMTARSYSEDSYFSEAFAKEIRKSSYDCIFSFDYFPLLSIGAQDAGIPYISWATEYMYSIMHYQRYTDHRDSRQLTICLFLSTLAG